MQTYGGSEVTNLKQNKPLPWWVELLFVQIGLPDRWLRNYLKTRKKARLFISDNSKNLSILLIFILTMTYLYPIVKQSRYHNKCILNSKDYIKSKIGTRELLSEKEIEVISISMCNGGNLDNF